MTEHILNFAIGIDDDAIIKTVQEKADKEIINDIKADILNALFTTNSYYTKAVKVNSYTNKVELTKEAKLNGFSEKIIKSIIEEYKDDIINRSAEMLCESYKKTKAWKEKAQEKMNE